MSAKPFRPLRYAVAGTGNRARSYVDALDGEHADHGRIVAWCEPNPGRTDHYDDVVVGPGAGAPVR